MAIDSYYISMDMGIPPLKFKILLESNSLKSIILVRILAAIRKLTAGAVDVFTSKGCNRHRQISSHQLGDSDTN